MPWVALVLAFATYLLLVAWGLPRFARARPAATVAGLAAAVLWGTWPGSEGLAEFAVIRQGVVIPSLVLLAAYRLSGLFFVRPSPAFERKLLAVDDALIVRTGVLRAYDAAPGAVRELVELLYLLVYAVVPAGAAALIGGGHARALDEYWAVVFAAELACYAVLPWVQTRPPRAMAPQAGSPTAVPLLRRLNLMVLGVASIQANTFPSAHAAGAIAAALAVASALPSAGAAFFALAIGITIATVLGRYHYALDSILGVLVALGVWLVIGR